MASLQKQKWLQKKIKAAMEFVRHAKSKEDVNYDEQEEEAKQNLARLVTYYHQGEAKKGGYLPIKGQALYYVIGEDKKGRIQLLHPVYLDIVKISKREFGTGVTNIWFPTEFNTDRWGVKCDSIKVANSMLEKAKFLAEVGRDFKQEQTRQAIAILKGIHIDEVPRYEIKKKIRPKIVTDYERWRQYMAKKIDKKLSQLSDSESESASESASASSSSSSSSESNKKSKSKSKGEKMSKKHKNHGSSDKEEKETTKKASKSKKSSKSAKAEKPEKKSKSSKKSKKAAKETKGKAKKGATRTRLGVPANGGISNAIYDYIRKHKKATVEDLQNAATKMRGTERQVTENAVRSRLERVRKIFEKNAEKTLKVKGDSITLKDM